MRLNTRKPIDALARWRAFANLGAIALYVSVINTAFAGPDSAGPQSWADDLTPIAASDWSEQRAAHLLERAGFGATPEEIAAFAKLTPQQACEQLLNVSAADNGHLKPFDHSGIHDPGLEPFPVSRPAATDLAKAKGEALGVKVKPEGNRRMQPVVNKFFYWLRASRLETNRVAYWWANRMLSTRAPLQEKMALFWHGHFAVTEEKVRDYRKMLRQLELLNAQGLGNYRALLVGVAKDPAMLAFLDAGVNVKGAPNENFAREIMEMFSMGVGNYSETDIREAARAFTGWNYHDLEFVVNHDQHDDTDKTVLGKTGRFDGEQVIDVLLAHPVSADFIAGKLYRYFVRQELTPAMQRKLGAILRDHRYDLAPLLRTLFLSKDFYSARSYATRIKSPVELAISTYKKLGLTEVPGVPDFNEVTGGLGQQLLYPPTVAGWAHGRAWITPALLMERGNFARDVLFPDINFIAPDRYPNDPKIRAVHEKTALGLDITASTMEVKGDGVAATDGMAMSNMMADRDEDFNTRYASYRGWQMAIEKVTPIPRAAARLDLAAMVAANDLNNAEQVVDYFLARLMRAPVSAEYRAKLIAFLTAELGTADIAAADSFLEEPLRMLVHLIMSAPEYQLG